MKRKFYVIQHNPNKVTNALMALESGANALEPDIVKWHDGSFRCYDSSEPSLGEYAGMDAPLLSDYCLGLAQGIINYEQKYAISLNLALIMWDLKNTDKDVTTDHYGGASNSSWTGADFLKVQQIIQENFTAVFGDVPMVFTTPQDWSFLKYEAGPNLIGNNQAIGEDENGSPSDVYNNISGDDIPITYGYGISNIPALYGLGKFLNWLLSNFGTIDDIYNFFHLQIKIADITEKKYVDAIQNAVNMRDWYGQFSLVYVWVVDREADMRLYLDMGVDAINTDNPTILKNLITGDYADKYELADRYYNPFSLGTLGSPETFKVRTFQFLPDELFVAVNNVGANSTLLKFRNPSGTGHNMFAVSTDGHGNYSSLPSYDYLLGSQLFEASIVDVVYAAGTTLVALSNGQVLKIASTGGTGENMFAVIQNAEQSASASYGNDSFTSVTIGNYTYPYYLGDQSFTNPVTLLKYINGYLYVGLSDGWLIKIKNTGGTGHNMFNITETPAGFVSDPNFNTYWTGDQKFNDFVRGMEYIPVPGGALFIWFNNGKLLKLNGTDAGAHTMFNITESSEGFEQIPGFYQYYIGDQVFSALVNTVCYSPYDFTFIGLDNGKILKVTHVGGTGHTMFNVTEIANGFEQVGGFSVQMVGYSYFTNCFIREIQVFGGDTYVAMAFDDGTGSVLHISGAGGSGSDMFAVKQNGNIFSNVPPYTYYIGDQNTPVPVQGLNFISEGPMNNIWRVYIEFANGLLLKAALDGTGNNMFAVTMNQTAIYPLPGYNYYIGEEYLP